MVCVDDPYYIYFTAAVLNFVPYLLPCADPRSSLPNIFITLDLSIVVMALINSVFPHLNASSAMSSVLILFSLSSLIISIVSLLGTVGVMFLTTTIFSGSLILTVSGVRAGIQNTFGFDVQDAGVYAIFSMAAVAVLVLYYFATKSYWLLLAFQTVVYSLLVTISVKYIVDAGPNYGNIVVCCDPNNLANCPLDVMVWWTLVLFAGLVGIRAFILYRFNKTHGCIGCRTRKHKRKQVEKKYLKQLHNSNKQLWVTKTTEDSDSDDDETTGLLL